jgi:hypothetical protein
MTLADVEIQADALVELAFLWKTGHDRAKEC